MNTPAHALINLALLARRPADHRRSGAIVAGALLPDLAMILFYAWHRFAGTAEAQIWSQEYYDPRWQAWFDSFNSIPLILLAMWLCWKTQRTLLFILLLSMLLHCFGDLPLHHDDAHRHFFPLFDWRFASPVSYWDPAHYGRWASGFEFCAVLVGGLFLYRRDPRLRYWAGAGLGVYFAYLGYVLAVWA